MVHWRYQEHDYAGTEQEYEAQCTEAEMLKQTELAVLGANIRMSIDELTSNDSIEFVRGFQAAVDLRNKQQDEFWDIQQRYEIQLVK